jgi:phosphoribosyl-ATP pyrophosphohydrolase/phosphoribosyl-AMP cyclohydrolase
MNDINELKYNENGLIPAIIVDAETQAVLMLAYMNEESLKISISEGKTCFYSRSRKKLWRKGETSGNVQNIINIKTDCDKDTLLISVKKEGPACHTGADSCFGEPSPCAPFSLNTLYSIITDRKANVKPGSYTNYLFEKGIDKILKKLGEESTEVIIAAKADNKEETIYELTDLAYHALVLMAEMGITPDEIKEELASRHNKPEEDK